MSPGMEVFWCLPRSVVETICLETKCYEPNGHHQISDKFPRNSVTELFKGLKKRFKYRKRESRMIFKVRYVWHHLFQRATSLWVSFMSVAARWTSGRREKWRTLVERNRTWLRLVAGRAAGRELSLLGEIRKRTKQLTGSYVGDVVWYVQWGSWVFLSSFSCCWMDT